MQKQDIEEKKRRKNRIRMEKRRIMNCSFFPSPI